VRQWYAVKAKSRQEQQATNVLASRGIEVYLPEMPPQRNPTRSAGRVEPLFPGYLFANLAITSPEWVVSRSAPGVAYFVGINGVPSPLPDGLVESIRVRAEEWQRQGWRSPFQSGDRVVIDSGPFSGLDAIFDRSVSPSGRVRVLIDLISRQVPVSLDASTLRRASTASAYPLRP
jgi:transcriptional antiterminator RfaH